MIITIPGNPVPQQRARIARNRFYDPLSLLKKEFQPLVESQLIDHEIFTVPLCADITFYMPFTKSTSKTKINSGVYLPHSKRPDLDNLLKFYLDLLNGIVYFDDSLISKLVAQKVYSTDPKTVIIINPLEI
jgi:Holliday junction resolvase RusA-like endonuclease